MSTGTIETQVAANQALPGFEIVSGGRDPFPNEEKILDTARKLGAERGDFRILPVEQQLGLLRSTSQVAEYSDEFIMRTLTRFFNTPDQAPELIEA